MSHYKIQVGFAVALALLLLTGSVTWWSAHRNVETFRAVDHTYQVINELQDSLVEMLNMETGSRGFALTGNEVFLAPYQTGLASVQQAFAAAKQLSQDNPSEQDRLAELKPLIQRKIAFENEVVKLRQSGDAAGALRLVASQQGKQTMDAIRKTIDAMRIEEQQLLKVRTDKAQALSRMTIVIVALGSLVALGLVGISGGVVQRDSRKRRQAQADLDRFFMLSLDLLCIANRDGYFKRVNPAFTQTLGWSTEELLARPFVDFVHPDDRPATVREVEKQVAGGLTTMRFENRYQHKDGSWRWLCWQSTPQPDGFMFATARDITELKRAGEALRQAQEETARERARLQFIFDTAPVGIALTLTVPKGQETRLINNAHLRICDITREQADEPGIFKRMTHPEDHRRQAPFSNQVEDGTIDHYSLDKRYVHHDGTVVWVLFSFQRRRLDDGSFEDLSIVVDITGRKAMEEALRQSEEKLAVTLHSIGDAVLATDAEGRVTRLNRIAEKLTGWTQTEAQGHPVNEIFHIIKEDTRELAVIPVDKVLATGEIHGLANHTVIIARDGTERPIADSAAPIRDKDGRVLGVVLVFRDVTEEKKAEKAIRDSERQLRTLNQELENRVEERAAALQESERLSRAALDALTAHVAILDERGVIITTNKSWQDFAGQNGIPLTQAGTGANYLGTCIRAAGQSLESAAKMAQGIREAIAGQKKEFTLEYDCHSPTEKRWFLCHVTRFPGIGLVRVVVAHENITRTKLLQHQQFRNQRLESIGTLAGGLAHDLNNALAPILLGTEMLKEQYPDDSEMVDLIYVSAKRGADMVRQLLTFARGAEGERNSIQLTTLVKEMRNIIIGTFPKNIRFKVDCDEKLPPVLGDATQLHQVLLNLCVNARDAMPGGGTLTLEAQPVEVDATFASGVSEVKPGKYVMLQVRDTGTGIPPEIIDHIFDPFFTTKGPDKGTGLGLSTVMGIVKGHGGFLKVYSPPGQGSKFAVFLPVNQAGNDTEITVEAEVKFSGQGETILFVDDEAAVRETARLVLRRLNFKPLTATDGSDGMIKLAEHHNQVRAIVTDAHMPQTDGLAFIRMVRLMLPQIPVAVASGRLEKKEEEEFKALNVTARLDKPFTEGQLADLLKNLLTPNKS